MDDTSRTMSKENLLFQDENDAQLFVALYDFQSRGENEMSVRKGTNYLFYSVCSCILHAILCLCRRKGARVISGFKPFPEHLKT